MANYNQVSAGTQVKDLNDTQAPNNSCEKWDASHFFKVVFNTPISTNFSDLKTHLKGVNYVRGCFSFCLNQCNFDIISKTELYFVRRQIFASYQTWLPQV